MRRNTETHWESMGQYATDLFTDEAIEIIEKHNTKQPMFLYLSHLAPHSGNEYDPLQVRDDDLRKFPHIKNAAMISRLDESVGRVVTALQKTNMLQDTIILFMSDNGAPVAGIVLL